MTVIAMLLRYLHSVWSRHDKYIVNVRENLGSETDACVLLPVVHGRKDDKFLMFCSWQLQKHRN